MNTEMLDKDSNGEEPLHKKFIGAVTDFNTIVAIMLAICALTTAWATWIGDLHRSDQDSNYAKAERLNTEAMVFEPWHVAVLLALGVVSMIVGYLIPAIVVSRKDAVSVLRAR